MATCSRLTSAIAPDGADAGGEDGEVNEKPPDWLVAGVCRLAAVWGGADGFVPGDKPENGSTGGMVKGILGELWSTFPAIAISVAFGSWN